MDARRDAGSDRRADKCQHGSDQGAAGPVVTPETVADGRQGNNSNRTLALGSPVPLKSGRRERETQCP